MKRRYRGFFSLVVTLLCALIILGAGYTGIALGGEEMLKTPQEAERVTMTEEESNLFYSRIEDDVQLHPWNYYAQESERDGEVSAITELANMEQDLYILIALAADVEVQEVIRWYNGQDKSILSDVTSRYEEETDCFYFFYDDVIRLNGREYHVKFCSDRARLYSFSCLRPKEPGIRDSEEWREKKEALGEQLNQNSEELSGLYQYMYDIHWQARDVFDWGVDVELYLVLDTSFYELQYREESNGVDSGREGNRNTVVVSQAEVAQKKTSEEIQREEMAVWDALEEMEGDDLDLQMVELDDCILLMSGQYSVPAIYYDVIEQKVAGFHFFD